MGAPLRGWRLRGPKLLLLWGAGGAFSSPSASRPRPLLPHPHTPQSWDVGASPCVPGTCLSVLPSGGESRDRPSAASPVPGCVMATGPAKARRRGRRSRGRGQGALGGSSARAPDQVLSLCG